MITSFMSPLNSFRHPFSEVFGEANLSDIQENSKHSSLALVSYEGQMDAVKVILEEHDSEAERSWALIFAAANGQLDIVDFLLPGSDPKAEDSRALANAAINGHVDVIKTLLPVSDAKASGSRALAFAAAKGHSKAIKALIPVSDVGKAFNFLIKNKSWWAADQLSGHLPLSFLKDQKTLPLEQMPATWARMEDDSLKYVMPAPSEHRTRKRM